MNTKTKRELQNLAKQLQILSSALLLIVGAKTAVDVTEASQEVINALDQDETITEVR